MFDSLTLVFAYFILGLYNFCNRSPILITKLEQLNVTKHEKQAQIED